MASISIIISAMKWNNGGNGEIINGVMNNQSMAIMAIINEIWKWNEIMNGVMSMAMSKYQNEMAYES
jgi:hypothetical protein